MYKIAAQLANTAPRLRLPGVRLVATLSTNRVGSPAVSQTWFLKT